MGLEIDDLEEVEPLGAGSFGKVSKYVDPQSQWLFAMKIQEYDSSMQVYVEREIQNLKDLKHPNIVAYYHHDICDTNPTMKRSRIVLEYCDGGDIDGQVIKQRLCIPPPTIVKWVHQMANAIEYIHGRNIIHRDFKAANILLTSRNLKEADAKLCDFGMSRYIDDANEHGRTMTQNVGTQIYFAPEQFTSGYGFKVDIWALGILAHELFTGKHPFDSHDVRSLKMKHDALKTSYFQVTAGNVHPIVQDFIMRCLVHDPNYRPTITELLQHTLFTTDPSLLTPPPAKPEPVPPPTIDSKALRDASLEIARKNLKFITDMGQMFGADVARKAATFYKADLSGLINAIGGLSEVPESQQWKAELTEILTALNPFLARTR